MSRHHSLLPMLATLAGIGLFALMDAYMKSASTAIGAYSALLWRCLAGFLIIAPVWWWQIRRWPERNALKIHLLRGVVGSFMALTFFFALVRLPLAEAIAISFIAPLLALYLATLVLGERLQPRAIMAAVLGLAGTLVIVGGRIGREALTADARLGLAAVGLSALLYAWNLILQRQQALVASPSEVATFQNGVVCLTLGLAAPFMLRIPQGPVAIDIGAAAILAVAAAMLLSWAYRRAETQVLVPFEYTGFLWAALFGWLFFAEPVHLSTVAGAALIIVGCWIAGRPRTEQSAL